MGKLKVHKGWIRGMFSCDTMCGICDYYQRFTVRAWKHVTCKKCLKMRKNG